VWQEKWLKLCPKIWQKNLHLGTPLFQTQCGTFDIKLAPRYPIVPNIMWYFGIKLAPRYPIVPNIMWYFVTSKLCSSFWGKLVSLLVTKNNNKHQSVWQFFVFFLLTQSKLNLSNNHHWQYIANPLLSLS
jgi:hypothetical protein